MPDFASLSYIEGLESTGGPSRTHIKKMETILFRKIRENANPLGLASQRKNNNNLDNNDSKHRVFTVNQSQR